MLSIAIAVLLAQAAGCSEKASSLIASARIQAEDLDLSTAADAFDAAANDGCVDAQLPAIYVRGLIAAREAYRFGGSAESLAAVTRALARIDLKPSTREAEIVTFVLRAAMAAAQSERDDLSLLIEHAVDLEAKQQAAGLSLAPIVTAHEAAGDLWLQVHRYEDARRAYLRAGERIGWTHRVRLGLARAAARLADNAAACEQYRMLLASWPSARAELLEVGEARAFLETAACRTPQRTR